eukprot:2447037-Rhodomonas_salina.1
MHAQNQRKTRSDRFRTVWKQSPHNLETLPQYSSVHECGPLYGISAVGFSTTAGLVLRARIVLRQGVGRREGADQYQYSQNGRQSPYKPSSLPRYHDSVVCHASTTRCPVLRFCGSGRWRGWAGSRGAVGE